MNDISRILEQIHDGEVHAAESLLPLVYAELRQLAAHHLNQEAAGNTLNATALVHKAYLRLIATSSIADARQFTSRQHFYAAAALAMRRILVDAARRKQSLKRGGQAKPRAIDPNQLAAPPTDLDRWIDLDHVLTRFEHVDASAAEFVKLRIFAGLSVEEAGDFLGLSRASAFRLWTYARAWLTAALAGPPENS